MQEENYKKIIEKHIKNFCFFGQPAILDHAERFIKLAQNYPGIAADTLLHREIVGELEEIINKAESQLSLNEKVCEALIELAFNLMGMESQRVGYSEEERNKVLLRIKSFLEKGEGTQEGKSIIDKVIRGILQNMKQVSMGKAMASKIAESIEGKLDKENLAESFITVAKSEIQENVYYKIIDKKMSKFGNDSATGLRIVRHFDFVQVSSNPVIAARAYEEFPELWDEFRKIVEVNPQWQKNPQKYADEITLFATITSILPNLLVFRPLALLSDFHDGLVSYQLNPFLAEKPKASIKDAKIICAILKDILYQYDKWLGWDAEKWQGRPNIVFKVAASSPTAIEITKDLNEQGIGTNNTVTYSVSQEITLLFAEAEGMAKALKKGILPTQVYQTNMIGRTEDHLREAEAERLISKLNDNDFWQLAKEILGKIDAKESRQEITKEISSKKYLKSLNDERLAGAFKKYLSEGVESLLSQSEEDIQYSGIFVTRRVYDIFFKSKAKILEWLQKNFELSSEQANLIFDRIDLLPASKRRARDTYLVLGTPNVTNTEFPDQQLKVYLESKGENFNLDKYRQSIEAEIEPEIIQRLLEIEDFQKISELTPELNKTLKEIGIDNLLGDRGMSPKNWKNYGAVQKTMVEFQNAYKDFQNKVLEFVKA